MFEGKEKIYVLLMHVSAYHYFEMLGRGSLLRTGILQFWKNADFALNPDEKKDLISILSRLFTRVVSFCDLETILGKPSGPTYSIYY